ncbi:MAG: hydrogenase formation protein HypD [Anaerolineae bacterium]|nr:hydrogenase formation protein HypD [Anaerolineae bacterium]
MKYVDEFRDPALARRVLDEIVPISAKPVQLMEFCGGHTHAIFKYGLRQLLPPTVRLRSGPGCPVCVTSAADIERTIALARVPGAILTTFGDMIRVPGANGSLQDAKTQGADVRVVYSPLDALNIAQDNPGRPVIFLGVGFETTAPVVGATLLQAEAQGVANFYVLSLHKLTPPAMRAILDAGQVRLDGVIGPGHVTTIVGSEEWRFLPQEYGIPCAVAGFEPLDILRAIAALVRMCKAGRPAVINAYGRSVQAAGNSAAQQVLAQVFEVNEAEWRGLGVIPASGLTLRDAFAHRDATRVFERYLVFKKNQVSETAQGCRCGDVLRAAIESDECPLFRRVCSPHNPVGPCMVSSEGACAAYYRYGEVT